jgi:hypothetical protein
VLPVVACVPHPVATERDTGPEPAIVIKSVGPAPQADTDDDGDDDDGDDDAGADAAPASVPGQPPPGPPSSR